MSTIYRVPSGAMKPTLALGQRVEVDEDAYQSAPPAIGDVVVFYAPLNVEPAQPGDAATGAACAVPRPGPGPERYIKRIVAGAGDVISIARGFVVRDGITETSDHVKAGDERLDQDFPHRSSSHRHLVSARRQPGAVDRQSMVGTDPQRLDHRKA